jgi:hypothetical protein
MSFLISKSMVELVPGNPGCRSEITFTGKPVSRCSYVA